jgi:U3 small nucleolar RNA-associated protein 11
VVFVDNEEQGTSDDRDCSKNVIIRICVAARQYAARQNSPSSNESDPGPEDDADLGWISHRRKSQQKTLSETSQVNLQPDVVAEQNQRKKRLIQQLSARLTRDKQLQYTAREFEMQRLLMGRGARRKLKGVEKVENGNNEDREDDDEADARKGKRKIIAFNEKLYKPREYKWRQERKR